MSDKSLLERLHADTKRHRAPQTDILPSWAKSGGKNLIEPATVKPLGTSTLEAPRKADKERKTEKKAKKKKK